MCFGTAELARSYPRHLDKIMAMLANGELKIRMEHANLRRRLLELIFSLIDSP